MIRQCFKTKSGIKFESEKLRHVGSDPSTLLYDENGDIPKRPPPTEGHSAKIVRASPAPKQSNFLLHAWRGFKLFFGFRSPFEDVVVVAHVES
jgi:hypothetical protein